MCDTIGLLRSPRSIFAKNSDRSPNEPQVNEFYPAVDHSPNQVLKTHTLPFRRLTIPTRCCSRPTWIWGGEMGVNEFGVCIGNEAVFTKGRYAKNRSDRYGSGAAWLERADSARQARDVIIRLLEEHGQGGNCGFDHEFFYDNSFLIMDREELFILETAGRDWSTSRCSGRVSQPTDIGRTGMLTARGKLSISVKPISNRSIRTFRVQPTDWRKPELA